MFQNKEGLVTHKRRKYTNNVYQVCQKIFNNKPELLVHMKNAHTERVNVDQILKCIVCDDKETSEEKLIKHIDKNHLAAK